MAELAEVFMSGIPHDLRYRRGIRELAETDPPNFITGGKAVFAGIGPATLKKLQRGA